MTRDVEINFNHIKFTIISHFMFILFIYLLRQHQPLHLHKDLLKHCVYPEHMSLRGRGFLLKYKIDIVFKSAHGMSWDGN